MCAKYFFSSIQNQREINLAVDFGRDHHALQCISVRSVVRVPTGIVTLAAIAKSSSSMLVHACSFATEHVSV